MQRIGILTFHRSRNYGAVLQAYALFTVVKDIGMDVEIIDYKCYEIEDTLKLWNGINEGFLHAVKQFVFRLKKKIAFGNFNRKYLFCNNKCLNRNKLNTKCGMYDCIISGSDQVWNQQYTGNDYTYFLDFYSGKKIAYAASTGDETIIDKHMYKYIQSFDKVSCREKNLEKYIRENIEIEVTQTCDPTILLGSNEFVKIANKCRYKNKYVFVFMISNSPFLMKKANDYAKKNNLIVINNKTSFRFFLHCSPRDFLSWILNAECIFTNSYHGVIFSILFHKLFFVDVKNGEHNKKGRIIELLEKLKLEECIISDDVFGYKVNPDFMRADIILDKMRDDSKKWLSSALTNYIELVGE